MVFLHEAHFQMPTTSRFTLSCAAWVGYKVQQQIWGTGESTGFGGGSVDKQTSADPFDRGRPDPEARRSGQRTLPQKTQVYLECCDTSIFLMILRSEAPYRVPYFPQIPTFFVRLPWWVGCGFW